MAELYHTIYTNSEVTPDTMVAVFILHAFGGEKYPGVSQARVEIVESLPEGETARELENKGVLSMAFEDARFSPLERNGVSGAVVKALKLGETASVSELLKVCDENNLQCKEIREILINLVKEYEERPEKVFNAAKPVLRAHFNSLKEEFDKLPTEYMNKLEDGKVFATVLPQKDKELRVMLIESDMGEMAPFLHNHPEIQADVVAQIFDSGHVNVTSRYKLSADLSDVAAILRIEEARKRKVPFDQINWNEIRDFGTMKAIPEWNFDEEENGVFNAKSHKRNRPTLVDFKDVKRALIVGLDFGNFDRKCPPVGCIGKKCKYYFYNLMRCRKKRLNADIDENKFQMQNQIQVLGREDMVKIDE